MFSLEVALIDVADHLLLVLDLILLSLHYEELLVAGPRIDVHLIYHAVFRIFTHIVLGLQSGQFKFWAVELVGDDLTQLVSIFGINFVMVDVVLIL